MMRSCVSSEWLVSDHVLIIHSNRNSKKGTSRGAMPEPGSNEKVFKKLTKASIDVLNEEWDDNERTSLMWEVIKTGDIQEFASVLEEHPQMAHIRSKDGRGPMWWAHEFGRPKMIEILRQLDVSEDRTDSNGVKPADITHDRIKAV
jgi:hypothetical protein